MTLIAHDVIFVRLSPVPGAYYKKKGTVQISESTTQVACSISRVAGDLAAVALCEDGVHHTSILRI